jgi:hypothetical protein
VVRVAAADFSAVNMRTFNPIDMSLSLRMTLDVNDLRITEVDPAICR